MKGLAQLKGVTGLPGIDGKRSVEQKQPLPEPKVADSLLLYDDKQADLARLVGSTKLARKVMALQRQYPNGTVPELLVMDWLNDQGLEYVYQAPLGGGRTIKGGLVADFLVTNPVGLSCWFIQGDYWHTQVGTTEKNTVDKTVALTQEYAGRQITEALELWENKLYKARDNVCQMALAGIELGR